MHVIQLGVKGNPNIGLYGYASNSFCLLGPVFSDKECDAIEHVLNVPCYRIKVGGSALIGALVTGNSRCLLVPNTIEHDELAVLQDIVKEINTKKESKTDLAGESSRAPDRESKRESLSLFVVPSKLTALGNNVLCNDHGALVNPDYSADVKKLIRQKLGVALHPGTIASVEVVGSCVVHNSLGAAIHRDASQEDIDEVCSLLKVPVVKGTVNVGSPYLRSAVLANDNGLVVGTALTGIEIEQLYEALGFLEKERTSK